MAVAAHRPMRRQHPTDRWRPLARLAPRRHGLFAELQKSNACPKKAIRAHTSAQPIVTPSCPFSMQHTSCAMAIVAVRFSAARAAAILRSPRSVHVELRARQKATRKVSGSSSLRNSADRLARDVRSRRIHRGLHRVHSCIQGMVTERVRLTLPPRRSSGACTREVRRRREAQSSSRFVKVDGALKHRSSLRR